MGKAKFEIRRKCKVCGNIFIAKTLESWYCSEKCSKIAWKRRKDEKVRHQRLDEIVKKIPKAQDYVKVSEAYAIFDISTDIIYRLIRMNKISYINLGKKQIRVSKEELAKLYPLRTTQLEKKEKPLPKRYSLEPEDCYTIGEIADKYHMNEATVYLHIRKYSIPTRQIGNFVYVPKKEIDELYKSL